MHCSKETSQYGVLSVCLSILVHLVGLVLVWGVARLEIRSVKKLSKTMSSLPLEVALASSESLLRKDTILKQPTHDLNQELQNIPLNPVAQPVKTPESWHENSNDVKGEQKMPEPAVKQAALIPKAEKIEREPMATELEKTSTVLEKKSTTQQHKNLKQHAPQQAPSKSIRELSVGEKGLNKAKSIEIVKTAWGDKRAEQGMKVPINTPVANTRRATDTGFKTQEKQAEELSRKEQQAKAKAEKIRMEQESKAKAEELRKEQEAKAKAEKIRKEQEAKAKAERIRKEQEAKAKAERIRKGQEAKAKAEKIRKAQEAKAQRQQAYAVAKRAAQEEIEAHIREFATLHDADLLGLSAVLSVRLGTDGAVTKVRIEKSSGNTSFDETAIKTWYKASPIPLPNNPDFPELREESRDIRFRFDLKELTE